MPGSWITRAATDAGTVRLPAPSWGTYTGGGYFSATIGVTVGTSASTFDWGSFTGLAAGVYDIAITWPSRGVATPASVIVLDGSTQVASLAIDENAAPASSFTITGSVGFTLAGQASIASGTATIRLSFPSGTPANSVADAVALRYNSAIINAGGTGLAVAARLAPSGQFVIVSASNADGSAAPISSLGSTPGVSADGTPLTVGTPIWGTHSGGSPKTAPYSPDLFLPVSPAIGSGAVVTVTLASGAIVTAAGSSASATLTASHPATLLPAPGTPSTFRVGYNLSGDYYGSAGRIYSNFAKGSTLAGPAFSAFDSNGYPTRMNGYATLFPISAPSTDYGSPYAKNTPLAPPGLWRCLIKSQVNSLAFFANASTTTGTVVSDSGVPAPGAFREIIFRVSETTGYSALFGLQITCDPSAVLSGGLYPVDLGGDLRVYPPDPADPTGNTAWTSPPKYYPTFATQVGRANLVRAMDGMPVNNTPARSLADLTTAARCCYPVAIRSESASLIRLEAYTGTDAFVSKQDRTPILCTTSAPHNFQTGDFVTLGSGIGSIVTSSSTYDGSTQTAEVSRIDSTHFVLGGYGSGGHSTMTNVLTPTGPNNTASMYIQGGGIPWDDLGNIGTYLGADIWRNIPHTLPDADIATIATKDAQTLPAGRKVVLEWSNECWNNTFNQYQYCSGMGRSVLGLPAAYDTTAYQVYRSIQAHRAYVAAWTAAGRSASDVVRYIGASPGTCLPVLQLCAGTYSQTVTLGDGTNTTYTVDLAAGKTVVTPAGGSPTTFTFPGLGAFAIDATGPALYLDMDPFPEPSLATAFNALNAGQLLDLAEYKVAGGDVTSWLAPHVAALASVTLPYAVQLMAYEFNLNSLLPLGQNGTNADPRPLAVHRHPRMRAIYAELYRQFQAAGVAAACLYSLNFGNSQFEGWACYRGIAQVPGTGLEPGATNVSDPYALPTVRSVVGQSVNDWNAALPAIVSAVGSGIRRIRGLRRWRSAS